VLAVIESGSKQYLVKKDQQLKVELIPNQKTVSFKPLMIIDKEKVLIGKPYLEKATVEAKIDKTPIASKKITILKFKPKKRYRKKSGHRQKYSLITITQITITK